MGVTGSHSHIYVDSHYYFHLSSHLQRSVEVPVQRNDCLISNMRNCTLSMCIFSIIDYQLFTSIISVPIRLSINQLIVPALVIRAQNQSGLTSNLPFTPTHSKVLLKCVSWATGDLSFSKFGPRVHMECIVFTSFLCIS